MFRTRGMERRYPEENRQKTCLTSDDGVNRKLLRQSSRVLDHNHLPKPFDRTLNLSLKLWLETEQIAETLERLHHEAGSACCCLKKPTARVLKETIHTPQRV
jgi:hypothetical protein